MKLARMGVPGHEIPAAQGTDGRWRDLRSLTDDITPQFLATLSKCNRDIDVLPVVDTPLRFGPPIAAIGKIVCVGLNYADHAEESGASIPTDPILFLKAADTVIGAYDDVHIPRGSTHTDWEVELAVVIGSTARYLDRPQQARECIAGYTISNDVSEREFQLERGGQWDKGKNCETFNPLGPWLVTADEVPDPQQLGLRLLVNDDLRQNGTTAKMIFGVYDLIYRISHYMALRPGDIINTGTPAGVALGSTDGRYLRAGDEMTVEIDGLGQQHQRLRAG